MRLLLAPVGRLLHLLPLQRRLLQWLQLQWRQRGRRRRRRRRRET
jgi:hypothetical protein